MNQIWKFKKALQSINTYPSVMPFKRQIERGNRQILTLCLSQIQMILSNPNQPPFSKFLALRFCRQIMLYGQQDIIIGMQKLIPAITKIASYKMQSKDPERGLSIFKNTQQYNQSSPQEQLNIGRIGVSFLILALQNIKMWATWIPVNPNGSQSLYKKSYNSLVQRGVTFPANFNYFKQNDTEIFNQTYKVQFFQNSDLIQNSQNQHQINEINVIQHLKILEQERQTLYRMIRQARSHQLQLFYNRIQQINQQNEAVRQYLQQNQRRIQLQRLMKQQEWINLYLRDHKLLINKKLSYQQFSKLLSNNIASFYSQPPLQIRPKIQMDPVVLPTRPSLNVHTNGISLTSVQPTTTIIKQQTHFRQVLAPVSPHASVPVSIPYTVEVQVPSEQDRVKISKLSTQLRNLQSQKQSFRVDLQQMRMKYQNRCNQLMLQLQSSKSLNDVLTKQVSNLKTQIQQLLSTNTEQVSNLNRQIHQVQKISQQKIINIQHFRAQQQAQQFRKLKYIVQTQKSQKMKLSQDMIVLRQQIFKLEQQLQNTKIQNQNIQIASDKVAKEKKRLAEQIILYKTQLSEQRTKQHGNRDYQITKLNQTISKISSQLEITKQQLFIKSQEVTQRDLKLFQMQKRISIIQQQRTKEQLNYQLNNNRMVVPHSPIVIERQLQASRSQQHFGNAHSFRTSINPTPTKTFFQFKQMVAGMEQYYTFFVQNSKELRIRFCKAALRSKQLLYKSNQIQVGVIWNRINSTKIKGIFHYTNNSTTDLIQFRTKIYSPKGLRIQILTPLSPILPISQQQKQQITFDILQLPLRKVVLQISYIKQGQPKLLTLLLPLFLLKFVDHYPPRRVFSQIATRRQFIPSSRITKNISSYFEDLRQVSNNKFQSQIQYSPIGLYFKLTLIFEEQMMIIDVHSQSLNQIQIEVLQEYLNQLQYILS